MKQILFIKHLLIFGVMGIIFSGCSGAKELVFANLEWRISDNSSQILDRDSTYRLASNQMYIPDDPFLILSSAASVDNYPGMDRFISDILHRVHLDNNAEILFYAPQLQTMFVRIKGDLPPMKPFSLSTMMEEEKPYTMWVQEWEEQKWIRKPSEMYTFTYYDKRRKQLLIVDCYDYGDEPIAQITIFQSHNKNTAKLGVPDNIRRSYWDRDLKNITRDIEFWAHQVDAHRKYAFTNYRIGQQQKLDKK